MMKEPIYFMILIVLCTAVWFGFNYWSVSVEPTPRKISEKQSRMVERQILTAMAKGLNG